MSEILYEDGSTELRSHTEVFGELQKATLNQKMESLFDLLSKKEVKSITLHKPGDVVEKDGKSHLVMEDGSWRECLKMADGAIYIYGDDRRLNLYKERDM